MIYPESAHFTSEGELYLGGIPACQLVETFGSPLYVVDEATVRRNCRYYTDTLKSIWPHHVVLFAGKANLNRGLLNLLSEEGLGLDVVSGGELYTALHSTMVPENMVFHGNNKSEEELVSALQHAICLVIDHEDELDTLIRLTQARQISATVMLRIKPEIEAHTHDYIKTGHIDSKFGIDKDSIVAIVKRIQACPLLTLRGLHSHIGSQIFDTLPYRDLATIMVGHMDKIRQECGIVLPDLNLGGGIGIQYVLSDDPPLISDYLTQMCEALKAACMHHQFPFPRLLVEPGRSIVGNAGVTLYTVGATKHISGIRDYLFVDGGMADNPRPMMYQSNYTFCLANKNNLPFDHLYTIAGKYCESGDILAKDVALPAVKKGDVLCVFGTGAYNYSMASHYNRCLLPAMVLVGNQSTKVLVKRDTYDGLIAHDCI